MKANPILRLLAAITATVLATTTLAQAPAAADDEHQVPLEGGRLASGAWVSWPFTQIDSSGNSTLERRRAEFNPPLGNNIRTSADGQAVEIVTRRHCTRTWTDPLVAGTSGNESVAPCPQGTKTRYSSGRIVLSEKYALTGQWDVTVTAQMPANPVAGTRTAVWMYDELGANSHLPEAGYCSPVQESTNLFEIDLVEWYGTSKYRDRPVLGMFVGCDMKPDGSKQYSAASTTVWQSPGWHQQPHTFHASFDGTTVRHAIDGVTMQETTASGPWRTTSPAPARWQAATQHKLVLWLQGEVFGGSATQQDKMITAVDDAADFPLQISRFEQVRLGKPTMALTTVDATMQGAAVVGEPVTVTTRTAETGAKVAHRWLRNGKPISGATQAKYTAKANDAGHQLDVVVTATADGKPARSRLLQAGTVLKRVPVKVSIKGTKKPKRGSTVKAAVTVPTGTRVTYQWLRNGKKISQATKAKYTVSSKDKRKRITVRVTVHKAGYASNTKTAPARTVR